MKKLFQFFLILLISGTLKAQLVINEFMASNSSIIQDDYGEYDDWIEIYNTGDAAISLDGYFITDNFNDPVKYKLPEEITIEAGSYLLIFTDNNNSQGDLHTNFKLSKEGEEIAIVKVIGLDTSFIDSLTYGEQISDVSYGRFPDGNTNFELFFTPTPETINISSNLLGIADLPVFSIPGGFYSGQQTIEISSDIENAKIRYTIDGSEPTDSSSLYTSAIWSDTTLILKAKVFADNYFPGQSKGYTYFIDEHFMAFEASERLPVVSVSCNPDYLWSPWEGILHDYNVRLDWEIPATIELYESDGRNVINQLAGLKEFGGYSSSMMEQKSLVTFARSEYGKNRFQYKLFLDKPFDEYKSFVMRNAANDWSLTYFRDAMCQELVRNDMDIDAQGSRQAIIYLNGVFYGICNIKEKIHEHYLATNHNADPDNIDMMLADHQVVFGDKEKYIDLYGLLRYSDMSDSRLYYQLNKIVDIREYINYMLTQIYIANIDMAINTKMWREKENYSKWRWILYDTEISFGQGDYSWADDIGTLPSDNTLNYASIDNGRTTWPYQRPWSSDKFIAMLQNEDFTNEFIQTFATHMNTTFKPQRVIAIIDSMQNNIRNEIPYQIEKYGGHDVGFNPYGIHFSTLDEWEENVEIMRDFARERPEWMRIFIEERFDLEGTYEFTPTINDPAKGTIYIQDIQVPLDSFGIYFDNIPIRISAVPKEGYKFSNWSGVNTSDSLSKDIVLTLSENVVLEAIFKEEEDLMISEIFYNSSLGDDYDFIEIYNPKHATAIDLSNYTITGAVIYTFPNQIIIAPNEYIVIASDSTKYNSGNTQIFSWFSGDLDDTADTLVLKDNEGVLLDSLCYTNLAPWPQLVSDTSIELIAFDLDNMGESWQKGIMAGGSPGIPVFTDAIYSIKINEFLANNNNYNGDEHNEYNDWIELLNTGSETVNIGGMFLTNNTSVSDLYQLPTDDPDATRIGPGEYILLWADNDTEQGPLHLGFRLDAEGGHIGLSADGKTIFEGLSYTAQAEDDSYGRYTDGNNNWVTFKRPTPGIKNSVPPVFISEPDTIIAQDEEYNYHILASDEDGDVMSFGVYQKPMWLNLIIEDQSVSLSGTTPLGFNPVSVKLFVTDGYTKPVIQEFAISRLPDSPEIISENCALNQLKIYPNPSNNMIFVETENSTEGIIEIYDITGKRLFTRTIQSNSEKINITCFAEGIYLLKITQAEAIQTRKIIIK
ncbi:lamin tail domain-containing protein [Bacteroidota bacterium]